MSNPLDGLPENSISSILLKTLAWRLGDLPDLSNKLMDAFSITQLKSYELLETLCLVLDILINENPNDIEVLIKSIQSDISNDTKKSISEAALKNKEKCLNFCLEHLPSLSRVLYHDWKTSVQVATESLGRIARPIASITMRIQPASEGKYLLPPLKSITMELTKDMIDALNSGFDRLQTQLVKIVQ